MLHFGLLVCAQDGGEVVFPDSGSVLLTFLKLEGGDLDTEVGTKEASSFINSIGSFCWKGLLISLPVAQAFGGMWG